ncbi:MAG: sugar ABC transporter permease [Clostridia bacterium]|nr:sugar ABC transporter permease [Clostridia bacterium]
MAETNTNERSAEQIAKNKRSQEIRRQLPYHLMMAPSVVLATIFSIVPLFGIIIAFQDFSPASGIFGSQFVDFYNFTRLFNRADFSRALFNTVYIALWKIVLTTVLSIVTALLLNEMVTKTGKKLVQTIVFLPYFLSWALIGSVFVEIFGLEGVANKLIQVFSPGAEKVDFLASNDYFRAIIIGTDLWKNLGYQAVVFLAAITNVDPTLYEAAEVDGANRWQQCRFITVPGIMTMIILISVLNIGNIMNAGFDQILVMYNPLVYETGDILDTMSYREAMVVGNDYSLSTAISLFKSVISCIFFAVSYKLAYKFNGYTIF